MDYVSFCKTLPRNDKELTKYKKIYDEIKRLKGREISIIYRDLHKDFNIIKKTSYPYDCYLWFAVSHDNYYKHFLGISGPNPLRMGDIMITGGNAFNGSFIKSKTTVNFQIKDQYDALYIINDFLI